jgi:phosphate starvation-inducible protein PhoH and related proteins
MNDPNRNRKGDIKYNVTLNEEQKQAKQLIIDNQIVVVTGRAGSGKSLLCAQTALGFLQTKQCQKILVTRSAIEVGNSLGFLPGDLKEKFDPYLEAFQENLFMCYDKTRIMEFIREEKIVALPVQFVRGKTINDVLVVEEAQNLTKHEMLALLTRLGKTGKIIINGDLEQRDIREEYNGLSYAIELAKKIDGIEYIKLKHNHRSDLVGKILEFEYDTKKLYQ